LFELPPRNSQPFPETKGARTFRALIEGTWKRLHKKHDRPRPVGRAPSVGLVLEKFPGFSMRPVARSYAKDM